jgi:hypothetical protein
MTNWLEFLNDFRNQEGEMQSKLNFLLDKIEEFDSNKVFKTDKRGLHSYINNLYEPLFELISHPKLIIEIGIFRGVSIALWKSFYPEATVIGVDKILNKDLCPVFSDMLHNNQIVVMIEDGYNNNFEQKLPNGIDILIDDGPHTLDSQIFFLRYRSKLSIKGVLIIEDISGGFKSISRLIKSLNSDEVINLVCIPLMFNSGRFDDLVLIYSKNVEIIEFFKNQLTTIQKIALKSKIAYQILKPFVLIARIRNLIRNRVKNWL